MGERRFQFIRRIVTSTVDNPNGVNAAMFEQGITYLRWLLRGLPFEQDDSHFILKKDERAFEELQDNPFGDHALAYRLACLYGARGPCQYPELTLLNRQAQMISILLDRGRHFLL